MINEILWKQEAPAGTNVVMEAVGDITYITCYRTTPERVKNGLLALYKFDERQGDTIQCSAGNACINLKVFHPDRVEWHKDGGLKIIGDTIIISEREADAITRAIRETNQFTFETWFYYDGGTSGNILSRFLTLSGGASVRNFSIMQIGTSFQYRVRTSQTNKNGSPFIATESNFIENGMVHMVCVRGGDGSVSVYTNAERKATGIMSGNLSNWEEGYSLALANENNSPDRPWKYGTYELVAIYNRALNGEEIKTNFLSGPRQ